jgi:hypothetical protein
MTPQNSRRRLTLLLCGMPLLLSLACSNGGIGPREYTLLECSPVNGASASAAIGPEGGTVTVGGHSLTLPANAVSSRVTFRMVERQDKYVGVEVEPHGTQFNRDATLTLGYGRCGNPNGSRNFQILEVRSGTTQVLRALPVTVDSAKRTVSTTRLNHLSGYLVGGNRAE